MAAPGWDDEGGEEEEPLEYYYPNAGAFVHQFMIPTFRKHFNDRLHWCTEWWKHPEALAVLTAMWDSWEHSRQDPWRMAAWFRDVAYPLFDRITSEQGPFVGCKYGFQDGAIYHEEGRKLTVQQLPIEPIPTGFFQDVETVNDREKPV